jgi:type I restriction enzyme S subunit
VSTAFPAVQSKLKHLATINDEALGEDTDADFEMQYVDISNVDSSGHVGELVAYRFEDAPSRARRRVRDGDVIISTVRTYLQAIAQFQNPPENMIASTGFAVVRPKPQVFDVNYCKFALREPAFLAEVERRSVGVSYPAINASDLANITVHVHPLPKQRAIAHYLDRETARLDALVAAKERVLGLLAEKRRALITRAVTRGLDPRAPLRDSGIPWLGEIPAHWRINRLKFHLNWIEQGWSPLCDSTPAALEEWGVLKAGCVNAWDFDPAENKRLPDGVEPLPQYEVRQGDVLMSRANTTALLGNAAIVGEVRPRLLICDKLYRLGVNDLTLCREFLVAFLRSPVGRYEFERDATGASNSMQNIGQDSVRSLWIPVPPIEEQRVIVDRINAETVKIEAVRSTTEHTVRLLKERRAALIAAVVTGKIHPQPSIA